MGGVCVCGCVLCCLCSVRRVVVALSLEGGVGSEDDWDA